MTEDYPVSLLEFEKRFNTEEACLQYVTTLRWPEGFRCLRCGSSRSWPKARRAVGECSDCRSEASATAGTIFYRTRLPLTVWFRAMWFVTSQKTGGSARGFQRQLGLTRYETVWTLLHKLRRAMVRPGRDRLSGRGEIAETYVGGEEKGVRGRRPFYEVPWRLRKTGTGWDESGLLRFPTSRVHSG